MTNYSIHILPSCSWWNVLLIVLCYVRLIVWLLYELCLPLDFSVNRRTVVNMFRVDKLVFFFLTRWIED